MAVKVTQGIDFSWARPGGQFIKQQGKDFVCRYVPYPGDGGKGLTADEVTDYHANDVAICLVWESTADRWREGWWSGVADAQQALASLAELGVPDDRPVYFACDREVSSDADFAALSDYLQGAGSVMGGPARVGVYGSYAVVERMHALGIIGWAWQTYAWSYRQVSDWRNLYQYRNAEWQGQVDFTEGYGDDYGQWPVYTTVYQRADTLNDDWSNIQIDPQTARPYP